MALRIRRIRPDPRPSLEALALKSAGTVEAIDGRDTRWRRARKNSGASENIRSAAETPEGGRRPSSGFPRSRPEIIGFGSSGATL